MALFSGWVFVVRPDPDDAAPALLPRYLVLAKCSLLMYRRDPTLVKNEEPVSSGVLTPQLAVEDCGREVYADGRALHAFRVYNKAMPDQGGKVATTSAGAAQKWISAIEESIKESETGGKPEKASVGERTLTRLVSIGQGLGDIFTREMQADVDVGGDAIETTKWRIFKVADGLRFFHEASEEGFESLIKAEGVVEASADSIFEVLMSTSAPLSMQWDTFTVENEVVEAVDGHTDIIYAIVTNRQYTHGRPLEKEVLASRTWRRNHDGSYGITTFNTNHDSKPTNGRRPRLEFALGSWDILPLTPARPKSGHVKCLVRHVIELGTAPSLSSSPSSRYTDSPTPPTPSKRSVSPSPSAFASQSVSSPVHSALPRPAQAVAGVAKAAAGKPISFIKGLMREKKEKELPKSASVAVGGGVGGAGGVGGGGLVEVEEEADGHVAFEEFADSFPYASLCRIAGLREYFAAQPAMEEHVERNTEEVVASLMERTESLEDQFFDAEGEEAEPAKEKVSAKARWQGLKWMVQFGFRLRSLFLVEEEEADKERWEVRRELQVDATPTDLLAVGEKLRAVPGGGGGSGQGALGVFLVEEEEADKERWEVRRELQVDATPTDLLAVGEKLRAQASLPLGVDPKDAHAWKQAVSDNFCVRGATYLSDGIKVSSSSTSSRGSTGRPAGGGGEAAGAGIAAAGGGSQGRPCVEASCFRQLLCVRGDLPLRWHQAPAAAAAAPVSTSPTHLLAVGEKMRAQASLPLGVDPKGAHAWKQAVSDNFCVRGATYLSVGIKSTERAEASPFPGSGGGEDEGAGIPAAGSGPKDAHAWKQAAADNFCVRGSTYLSDGIKIPAAQPLLSLLAVDWFKSDSRIDNLAARPGSVMQSEAGKKLPFVFVLNLQVPGKPNYSCVAYFAADRPVKKDSLLGRFVNAEDDSFRNSRFKLIPRIEEGFWAVKRAVGTKAAILGKALTCSYFKGENYLEMDVDVGSSSVARSVIGLVLSYVTSLVVDLALLIEEKAQQEKAYLVVPSPVLAYAANELPKYLFGTITPMRLTPGSSRSFLRDSIYSSHSFLPSLRSPFQAQAADELPEYLLGTITLMRLEPKKAIDPPPA
ncbi:unnamed protein product [Closterium sp. Naga37s-1]|nr:unnamed protein product [Closterium sp. Naga37s-1]